MLAEVVDVHDETPRVRTIVLDVPGWPGHRAGQHVVVRLTAEDGYTAQRSYSIASAPADPRFALTVERIEEGEVSPYLVDELRPGDPLELRGPIGGWFTWEPALGGPVQLIAGGSGIVPLAAMLRHRAALGDQTPARLLVSARTWEEAIYRDEDFGVPVTHTLTRGQPAGWTGYTRRIDADLLAEVTFPAAAEPLVYVCGPTGLVETVTEALVALGHASGRIRAERFGPSG